MSKIQRLFASEAVTFADLSERQAAFVREYVERGGRPGAAADAAVAAGYARPGQSWTRGSARARIRAAPQSEGLEPPSDELTRKLKAGATLGVQTLIDLLSECP
jgi:hypothetical protein